MSCLFIACLSSVKRTLKGLSCCPEVLVNKIINLYFSDLLQTPSPPQNELMTTPLTYTKASTHTQTLCITHLPPQAGLFSSWLIDTDPPCYFPQVLALSLTTIIGELENEQWQSLRCAFSLFKRGGHFKRIIWADIYTLALRRSECHFAILTTICSCAAEPFKSDHTTDLSHL